MKSTTGWDAPNTDATNSSGFSGLPGGTRTGGGSFTNIGTNGFWWSSTEHHTSQLNAAVDRNLYYNHGDVNSHGLNKSHGNSCRCLKD